MNGFFVTGTDTGVGKTVLSALLVAALDGIYWKPVQTGAIEGTDRNSVRAWAGCPEERLLLERYYFDPPVSPHLAAREAGVRIALDTSLGTINHTLLTLAALRGAQLSVHGVVLIGAKNIENRRAIERFGKVRVIGHIPVLEKIHCAALLEVFANNFDRQAFP